jgi:hypothetical protein
MPDDRSWDSHVSESLFDVIDVFKMQALVPVPEYDEYLSGTDSLTSGRRMAWTCWAYDVDPPTPTDGDFMEEDAWDVLAAEFEESQCATERYLRSLE